MKFKPLILLVFIPYAWGQQQLLISPYSQKGVIYSDPLYTTLQGADANFTQIFGSGIATVPSAGQILVGNSAGTAYVPRALSGDCTLSSIGVITCPTGGSGTVTNVAFNDGSTTPLFVITGSPITASGTLTETLATQLANLVFAGPSTGTATQPAFRALVAADIPTIPSTQISGLGTLATQSGTFSGTSSGTNTGDQTITLTGDVTGSGTGSFAATVKGMNGTLLSSLNTGLLKNTTGTGVPSIAVAGTDYLAGTAPVNILGVTGTAIAINATSPDTNGTGLNIKLVGAAATTTGVGGAANQTGGVGCCSGDGGNGGQVGGTGGAGSGTGAGGGASWTGGAGGATGNGGAIVLTGGAGGATSGSSGGVTIKAGAAGGAGTLGSVGINVNTNSATNIGTGTDTSLVTIGGGSNAVTVNATTLTLQGAAYKPVLTGTTGSIGGSALLAGACSTGTVSITGATTGMAVVATPVTYPTAGNFWQSYVSSAGVVTVAVCAAVADTPTASVYNVRIIQ